MFDRPAPGVNPEAMRKELSELLSGMTAQAAPVSTGHAERIALDCYGIEAIAQRLTGERDENFQLRTPDGAMYVLKVANPLEERAFLELLTAALLHVEQVDPTLPCPHVHRDLAGRAQTEVHDEDGTVRSARMLTWVAGKPLRMAERSAEQRRHCGQLAARLSLALRDFSHPAAHRPILWNLCHLPKMQDLLQELPDFPRADLIAEFIAHFEADIVPRLATVRQQVTHNDLNDRNILVADNDDDRIAGIIDFGDTVHTPLIADVAIMMAEQICEPHEAEPVVAELLAGYESVTPLLKSELAILRELIVARIVMSAVIPSWHRHRNPTNTHYARVTRDFVSKRMLIAETLLATAERPA
ncbi:phosphotransferase [Steroidobacter flavus]|uniref:Hydroxylysine kinase n=1 Tax=Steroidobacter flavus TaxID=1842136 RepID=A0ABV8SMU2_9GAMM